MSWFIKCIRQYADFNGRAHRKEYWMFVLFCFLFAVAARMVDALLFGQNGLEPVSSLLSLFLLLPSLAAGTRRLHDTSRSAWWLLIALVPVFGVIVLIVFFALPGVERRNRYGPDPRDEGSVGAVAA